MTDLKDIFDDFVTIKDNTYIFKLNSEIYSKEVILQAVYVLIDDLYILVDKKENYFYLYVKSKKKNKENLKEIAERLIDELNEANAYIEQAKRTGEIRKIILERALLTNLKDIEDIINKDNEIYGNLEKEIDFFKNDN